MAVISVSIDNRPVIDDVVIPIDLERFIPPDLEAALKYYPDYLRAGGRQPIQPYLLCVVKAYRNYEREHGRPCDEDEVLKQYFRHVGLPAVFELLQKGMRAHELAGANGGFGQGSAGYTPKP